MPANISGERPYRRSRIVQVVATPAAGADWSQAVPAGHVWRVLAARALLTADANVANRIPVLTLADEGVEVAAVPAVANITAGQAITITWAPGLYPAAFGTNQGLPLPLVDLEPGGSIGVSTAGKQVGDTWTAIRLWLLDTTFRGGSIDLADIPEFSVELVGAAAG